MIAKANGTQYQKMIRKLLNLYLAAFQEDLKKASSKTPS
jgi:hypothetical protein